MTNDHNVRLPHAIHGGGSVLERPAGLRYDDDLPL
jgi:hypothetical protein